ncbi:MAG: restriction endonuclease subunit S [Candidatus Bruticola sp.]
MALFKSWFIDYEPFGGSIPENWTEYKLGDFLPVITGKKNVNVSSSTGTYPFFSCSQDITWTDKYSFEGSAILVAGNGDFNVKFYNGKFEAYQRTYVLIPYSARYTAWLFYAVKYNLNKITLAARGSVIKFITKGNLEDFSFYAPKNLVDFGIIDQFTTINDMIASNREESAKLSQIRDTLLPKLMSGELDVSDIDL